MVYHVGTRVVNLLDGKHGLVVGKWGSHAMVRWDDNSKATQTKHTQLEKETGQ